MNRITLAIICFFVCINTTAQQKRVEFQFTNGTKAFAVTDDGEYWGVEDASGNIILPKEYAKLDRKGNFIYCSARKGSKDKRDVALYDSKGKCLISDDEGYTSFDFVIINPTTMIASSFIENGKPMVVFDGEGKLLYKYEIAKDAKGFPYLKNAVSDTIVIEPGLYTNFKLNGDVIITKNGDKCGVSKLNGEIVLPPAQFETIVPYRPSYQTEGYTVELVSLGKSSMQGYYDKNGKCIVPVKDYTFVRPMGNKFYVKKNDFAGIIDSLGHEVLMSKYRSLVLVKNEAGTPYYKTIIGNGTGKMTLDGKVLQEPAPTISKKKLYVPLHNNDYSYVQVIGKNGLFGIETEAGKTIFPCDYSWINLNVCNSKYDKFTSYFELTKNGFQGIAREDGTILIPCNKYHSVQRVVNYGDNYFYVERYGKYGLCEKDGKEIIPPLYDKLYLRKPVLDKERKESIIAKKGINEGVLDFNGNIIVPFEYTKITPESESENFKVEIFGKEGLCGKDGNIIIPAMYTRISLSKGNRGPYNDYYKVWDGDTQGIYTTDGHMVFPTGLFTHLYIDNQPIGIDGLNWYIKASADSRVCFYDMNGEFLKEEKRTSRAEILNNIKMISKFDSICNIASNEFDRRRYKKAINLYNQALTFYKNGNAYYNIGAAYFNMGKYKDAISSLKSCVEISKDKSTISDAVSLIEESERCIEKRRERRANTWMKIIGTALNVGVTVMKYNYMIKTQDSQNKANMSGGGQYVRNTSHDYLLDPRYTMMQIQQQYYNEYLQMTNGGQTMTYEEWFNKIKGPALAEEYRIEHGLSNSTAENNDDEYKGELSPDQYEDSYKRWENRVKDWFSNLTSGGIKVQDKQGNISGKTDGDMKGWAYVGNQSGLKHAQSEMRKIRLEAQRYGVNIAESKWETATANY